MSNMTSTLPQIQAMDLEGIVAKRMQ